MSDTPITLKSDLAEAVIAPSFGGALLRYHHRGVDVLRPGGLSAVQSDPRNAAYFPCGPYFGRLAPPLPAALGAWSPRPNLPACDPTYALHGEGWVSPWRVETANASAAKLRLDHSPQHGDFPFRYTARQFFRLSDEGLSITLETINTGDAPMPCGLALHPFFPRSGDVRIKFRARRYWTPPSGAARGALSSLPDLIGGGGIAELPLQARDHTYAGVDGLVEIWRPGMRTQVSFSSPHLHAFMPAAADFFCLEPCSQLPGDDDMRRPLHGRLAPP